MKKAFVLINSLIGLEEIAFEKLKKLSSVKEIYRIYGVYDIALKVEQIDPTFLKNEIENNIRKVEGVGSTLTMLVN